MPRSTRRARVKLPAMVSRALQVDLINFFKSHIKPTYRSRSCFLGCGAAQDSWSREATTPRTWPYGRWMRPTSSGGLKRCRRCCSDDGDALEMEEWKDLGGLIPRNRSSQAVRHLFLTPRQCASWHFHAFPVVNVGVTPISMHPQPEEVVSGYRRHCCGACTADGARRSDLK